MSYPKPSGMACSVDEKQVWPSNIGALLGVPQFAERDRGGEESVWFFDQSKMCGGLLWGAP